MSFWVRTFATKSLGNFDIEDLTQVIKDRLPLLTTLFCPDDEEEPELVSARLRIEVVTPDKFRIYYRQEPNRFMLLDRCDQNRAQVEVEEELERVEPYPDPGVKEVKAILAKTVETVAIELKLSDEEGMGLPVAVAAAARLAEKSDGLIYVDYHGWMVPHGREVRTLVEA